MASRADKRGRSKGELSQFFAIETFIMKSPAWRSLSPVARSIYLEVGALYDWSNNGRLALSARQVADRMPIGRATATRGFQELVQKGFIVACKPSGFNLRSGERRATEWQLTRYKCNVTGALPTKAFMDWRPGATPAIGGSPSKSATDSLASPETHSGFTTEPPKDKIAQNGVGAALTRSRQANIESALGFTREPLLYSAIGSEQHTPPQAQRGAAHSEASASATTNKPEDEPVTWAFITGQPLKSLDELNGELPNDFRTWQPEPSPDVDAALKSYGAARKSAAKAATLAA